MADLKGKSKETFDVLKEIQLFEVFSDKEIKDLAKIGKTKDVEAYTNIVIEGELTWGLYLVLAGTVGVSKANNDTSEDGEYDLGEIAAPGFFGEMSLVDDNPRSATVRALTDCKLLFISKDHFGRFLSKVPKLKIRFYEACTKGLVRRLRELNDDYVISQYQLWKTALDRKKEGEEVA